MLEKQITLSFYNLPNAYLFCMLSYILNCIENGRLATISTEFDFGYNNLLFLVIIEVDYFVIIAVYLFVLFVPFFIFVYFVYFL